MCTFLKEKTELLPAWSAVEYYLFYSFHVEMEDHDSPQIPSMFNILAGF